MVTTRYILHLSRVRFPVPEPPLPAARVGCVQYKICGGHSPGETPGPIPNPEAKAWHGDGTAPDRVWESSSPPHHTSWGGPQGPPLFHTRHGPRRPCVGGPAAVFPSPIGDAPPQPAFFHTRSTETTGLGTVNLVLCVVDAPWRPATCVDELTPPYPDTVHIPSEV
jgi:hypothetical protein